MSQKIALIGNPNSGKTTLFNYLTGSKAHVGNWPGVTVERKEGNYKAKGMDAKIIDLPGIYSLSPYSLEEVVSRDYLTQEKPDLLINIVDATNLERNLYLTTQLVEMNIPMIVALNMMDEVEKNGDTIDCEQLSKGLAIPVVPISAAKGKGVATLMQEASILLKDQKTHMVETYLNNTKVYEQATTIREWLDAYHLEDSFFTAIKILESDHKILEKIKFADAALFDKIRGFVENSKQVLDSNEDWDLYIANARYGFIENVIAKCYHPKDRGDEKSVSDKIDAWVTHRYLAIPLFMGIMGLVFFLTFGKATSFLVDAMDYVINDLFTGFMESILQQMNVTQWLVSLIIDGIIPGVGMVLVVLPQLFVLFFFLTLLEDSGYMSRAAFVMDRVLRKFGLSGKSFIPMLMGFGCSVPAIMATRTLENEKDRRMTIILTPFMSCSARWPVYAVFIGALFADRKWVVILSIYLLGILVAAFSGILLKHTVLKGEASTFIMELPPYRMPTLKNLSLNLWEKCRGFVERAGTVLLLASIVVWFLQKFNLQLQMVTDNTQSIFGQIGIWLAPVFAPLGFGNWKASVALLTGFVAKEAVVSTLGILYGAGDVTGLTSTLADQIRANFTPLQAYAYMAFVLLYMPCIVAFITMKKELNSWKWTAFAVSYQTAMAYIVALIIYQVGSLLGF